MSKPKPETALVLGWVLGFGFFSSLVDISLSDDAIVAFDLDKIFYHEVSS